MTIRLLLTGLLCLYFALYQERLSNEHDPHSHLHNQADYSGDPIPPILDTKPPSFSGDWI